MPSQNHRPDHPHSSASRVANPSPLGKLYETLADLRKQIGGPYTLEECHGRADWPEFGLYFFFTHDSDFTEDADPTEDWSLSRIGTVGVRNGTGNPLWQRLRQHRGNKNGKYELGGNHRGSVYRKHVGRAIIEKEDLSEQYPEWGDQTSTPPELREQEHPLEQQVTDHIATQPFLYINVPGEPARDNARDYLETNLIALVSRLRQQNDIGPASDWLGGYHPKTEIQATGLWNVRHIHALYDPQAVHFLSEYINQTHPVDL